MSRKKSDPLIAALISKLPEPNKEWPVDNQIAWLNLMAMAFGTVYGGDAAARLGARADQPRTASAFAPVAQRPAKPSFPFYIDEQGFAKNKAGKRVKANDVTGELYDLRGQDGDMRGIIWADDSKGLNGANLVVVAV